MKKTIALILILLLSVTLFGCGKEPETHKDTLIRVQHTESSELEMNYFLVWASFRNKNFVSYNYYHKDKNGKMQLSYADVYDVAIYEDVPIDKKEYVIYQSRDSGGQMYNPEFHVHAGSIEPVVELIRKKE